MLLPHPPNLSNLDPRSFFTPPQQAPSIVTNTSVEELAGAVSYTFSGVDANYVNSAVNQAYNALLSSQVRKHVCVCDDVKMMYSLSRSLPCIGITHCPIPRFGLTRPTATIVLWCRTNKKVMLASNPIEHYSAVAQWSRT